MVSWSIATGMYSTLFDATNDVVILTELQRGLSIPKHLNLLQMAKAKAAAPTSSGGKAAKKKKWSKGKVKDKAQHAVAVDKVLFDRIVKEVPTFRMISVSTLIDRLKVNGSLARRAIQHLEKEGHIKRIVHHSRQLIYTRATAAAD